MRQVKDLGLCTVLLMDDATYPVWLVLVPRQVSRLLADEFKALHEVVVLRSRFSLLIPTLQPYWF